MERRDRAILQKVLREIDVAGEMMGGEQFKENEMLMRAIGMTVIADFPLLREQIAGIVKETNKTPGSPARASLGSSFIELLVSV